MNQYIISNDKKKKLAQEMLDFVNNRAFISQFSNAFAFSEIPLLVTVFLHGIKG